MGPPKRDHRKPGGQQRYSNHAIETALTVGMVFRLALRQTEGFLGSLFALLGVDCRAPDHTTISRRARKLGKLPFSPPAGSKPIHILVDSTGLSVHVGDLRKPPQNRDWRKRQASVNVRNDEVIACDGPDRLQVAVQAGAVGVIVGVGQLQINVVTEERLRQAQADPERYGNIPVRVAGYSQLFRLLAPELQDHIIARTKHASL
mgnify:CR=1 FL=1